jgi:hypothetical protein
MAVIVASGYAAIAPSIDALDVWLLRPNGTSMIKSSPRPSFGGYRAFLIIEVDGQGGPGEGQGQLRVLPDVQQGAFAAR